MNTRHTACPETQDFWILRQSRSCPLIPSPLILCLLPLLLLLLLFIFLLIFISGSLWGKRIVIKSESPVNQRTFPSTPEKCHNDWWLLLSSSNTLRFTNWGLNFCYLTPSLTKIASPMVAIPTGYILTGQTSHHLFSSRRHGTAFHGLTRPCFCCLSWQ